MPRLRSGETPKPAGLGDICAKAILGLGAMLLASAAIGRPAIAQSGHELRFCSGYFALCAASTCTPTGRRIKRNFSGKTP